MSFVLLVEKVSPLVRLLGIRTPSLSRVLTTASEVFWKVQRRYFLLVVQFRRTLVWLVKKTVLFRG